MSDNPPAIPSMPVSSSEKWTPQNIIAVYALTIAAATVAGVFLKGDAPTIQLVVGIVIGTGFLTVLGFYFGSSQGSQKKDEAKQAPAP